MAKFKFKMIMKDNKDFYETSYEFSEDNEGLLMSALAQETIKMSINLGITKEDYLKQMKEHYEIIEEAIKNKEENI